MRGSSVTFDWHGRTANAWVPARLVGYEPDLAPTTIRATEKAAAALRRSDGRLPANWEPLARLILRSEGIASSSIEGVRTPVEQLALAELVPMSGDVAWVADNLTAFEAALGESTLSIAAMHSWHERLMAHSHLPADLIGAFRKSPGWIGGATPLVAVFVPPPASYIDDLMDDLVTFATADDLDPITQAALVHGQFETIHPYGDGNGRLGRILIGWVLRWRGVVDRLPPPISVLIARDPGGYLSGLYNFRRGRVDSWVDWFADVVLAAADQSEHMIDEVGRIVAGWRVQTSGLRADATARAAIEFLPQAPVLSAAHLAALVGVSERSALSALKTLEAFAILRPLDVPSRQRGRPVRWWAATQLLDLTRT